MRDSLIPIGDVAVAADVSTRTIRHYELIGLVSAVKRGTTRYFYPAVVAQIILINKLKQLGFGLSEIGILLNKTLVSVADFRPDAAGHTKAELITRLKNIKTLVLEVEALIDGGAKGT